MKGFKLIPGEYIIKEGQIKLNSKLKSVKILVSNTGDRPIQVGSHYHFYESNSFLDFNRNKSKGMRLNIPSGTAIRFEPGQEKEVYLISYQGTKEIYGFNKKIMGKIK